MVRRTMDRRDACQAVRQHLVSFAAESSDYSGIVGGHLCLALEGVVGRQTLLDQFLKAVDVCIRRFVQGGEMRGSPVGHPGAGRLQAQGREQEYGEKPDCGKQQQPDREATRQAAARTIRALEALISAELWRRFSHD
ncbi:MAG: hypothetical protein ACKVOI_17060 [Dongiaceae bacterium]